MLDIFVFAFPVAEGQVDQWLRIWRQITYGYVAIGRFHDMTSGAVDPVEKLHQLQV